MSGVAERLGAVTALLFPHPSTPANAGVQVGDLSVAHPRHPSEPRRSPGWQAEEAVLSLIARTGTDHG
ncbi:hypothetical protein FHY05_002062 [Sphingomonas sp. BK580]|nr:hypothetical protein [Sphingomonas sp. BK580]